MDDLNFGEEYYQQLPELGEVMGEVITFFGGKRIYVVGGDFAANLIFFKENVAQQTGIHLIEVLAEPIEEKIM